MTASPETRPAGDSVSRRRMPEFFIVGHHKCGTSALWEMLRRHPGIYMPEVKETWYFSDELRSPQRRKARRVIPGRPETLDQYLALFDGARPEQRIGENSPAYLMSKNAARRIAQAQPDARIIAILREPASFLRSFHLQCLRNHVETEKDFAKAIALEAARRQHRRIPRNSARPHELLYSEHVRYVEQLRRYHDVFPRERVLVLIYEDFRRDNEATIRRVLDFLDVADEAPIAIVEANPSYAVRSARLHGLVHAVNIGRGPVSRPIKAGVKAFSSRRMRHELLGFTRRRVVYGEPQPADERVMLELRRRFKEEVVAASEYLDRDLVSLWGYDRLD
jgi:Sulfotransferase family